MSEKYRAVRDMYNGSDNFKGYSRELTLKQKLDIILCKFGITLVTSGYKDVYYAIKVLTEQEVNYDEFCFKALCIAVSKRTGKHWKDVGLSIRTVVFQVYANTSKEEIHKVLGVPEYNQQISPKGFIYLLAVNVLHEEKTNS